MSYVSYQRGEQQTMDDFDNLLERIVHNIHNIRSNNTKLNRYCGMMGTDAFNGRVREEMNRGLNSNKQLSVATEQMLKQLETAAKSSFGVDQRERRTKCERVINEFSDCLTPFQNIQREIAQKEKASIERARSSFSESQMQEAPKTGQSQTLQVLQMEQDEDLEAIRERERQLHQLENDITQVNEVFKDLAVIVHEQGEIIDNIEQNIGRTGGHVEQAVSQLQKAKVSQSKARRKKICLLVILLTILVVVGIIIAISVAAKNN